MSLITLTRLSSTPRETIGTISIDGVPKLWSLEPAWRMNKTNESCILPGLYIYKQYNSPTFKTKCIKLFNVYNREYVSIHYGNIHTDTKACILPGMFLGSYKNENAVLDSKKALSLLINQTSQIGKIQIVERC